MILIIEEDVYGQFFNFLYLSHGLDTSIAEAWEVYGGCMKKVIVTNAILIQPC